MKPRSIALGLGLLLAGNVLAQPMPAQPTPEQMQKMQQMLMQQMQMMAAMFDYRRSRLGFDETVAAVTGEAAKRGWSTPQTFDMQAEVKKAGVSDAKRMKVVETCPKDANERLARASGNKLPPLPCRYTVFEGRDGKTYVTRMNTGLIAKGLQGEAAKVMAEVASEEEAMLKGILEP